jgi:aspartyl-tRNA(Asn)/glutamyl-tRNA(Gln) amidotransferase subunit C
MLSFALLRSVITPIINRNMAKITVEEVLKLAKLSHLHLTSEEAEKYAEEIDSMLGYFEQLKTIDVAGYEPTDQVTELVNVEREDVPDDYKVTSEELLAGTPYTDGRYIKVKRVL